MEKRLGLGLPSRSRLWNRGGRIRPLDALLSESRPRRQSRLLWSLAGSKLGLGGWTHDIPFSLQHRAANLPVRTCFSRAKVQEPIVWRTAICNSPNSHLRLNLPVRIRIRDLFRLQPRRTLTSLLWTGRGNIRRFGQKTSSQLPQDKCRSAQMESA